MFFKIHTSRVMGVALDGLNNVIFSCSTDKSLKVTNIIDQKIIFG